MPSLASSRFYMHIFLALIKPKEKKKVSKEKKEEVAFTPCFVLPNDFSMNDRKKKGKKLKREEKKRSLLRKPKERKGGGSQQPVPRRSRCETPAPGARRERTREGGRRRAG